MVKKKNYKEKMLIDNIASCAFDTIFVLTWFLQNVFKQLNNLLLSVTSLCPRQTKREKKNPYFYFLTIFEFILGGFSLLLSNCTVYLWTKMVGKKKLV